MGEALPWRNRSPKAWLDTVRRRSMSRQLYCVLRHVSSYRPFLAGSTSVSLKGQGSVSEALPRENRNPQGWLYTVHRCSPTQRLDTVRRCGLSQ